MTNTNKMIHRMRSLGNLSTDEHKILMVSDGCRKQYKCANAIAAQIMTTEGFNVTINNMILCEYHGKSSVDALAGVDKNKLRNCLISDFDNATRDADNKIVAQAHVCKGVLSDESRRYGLNTDSKHKHHEGQGKVDERWYDVSNYDKDFPIPMKDVQWEIPDKQWPGGAKGKKNKLANMFNIYTCPDFPSMTAAVRRMPCLCPVCNAQLNKPWDYGKTYKEQERFKRPPNCHRARVLGPLNNWTFVTVQLKSNTDKAKRQVNDIIQRMIDCHVQKIYDGIELLRFGAINCEDSEGFWLVQWESEPFQLTSPQKVEGCGGAEMPEGTLVCKGTYFNKIHMAPGWYEKDTVSGPKLFWLQHVIHEDVEVERYNPRTGNVPPNAANREYDRKHAGAFTRFVPQNIMNLLKNKYKMRLSKLQLYLLDGEVDEVEDDSEEEDKQKKKRQRQKALREGFFTLDDNEGEEVEVKEEDSEEEEEEEVDETDVDIEKAEDDY